MRIRMKVSSVVDAIKCLHASRKVKTEIVKIPEPEDELKPIICNVGGYMVPLYNNGLVDFFDLRYADIPDEAWEDENFWEAYFGGGKEIRLVFDKKSS